MQTKKRNLRKRTKPYRRWTPEEDALICDTYPTSGARSIAEKLNRTQKSVRSRAAVLGVKRDGNYITKTSQSL